MAASSSNRFFTEVPKQKNEESHSEHENNEFKVPCSYLDYQVKEKKPKSSESNQDQYEVTSKGTLYLPAKKKLNPYIKEGNKALLIWLEEKGLIKEGTPEYTKIADTNIAALFSSPLNDKGKEELFLLTQFTSWLFMIDKLIDQKDFKLSIDELKKTLQIFYDIMDNKYHKKEKKIPVTNFPCHKQFCAAFYDIRESFNQRIKEKKCNPDNVPFFLNDLNKYFNSMINEIELQNLVFTNKKYKDVQVVDEDTYDNLRSESDTGAIKLTFTYLALILNINLRAVDKSRSNTINSQLERNGIKALAYLNDRFSYYKEKNELSHLSLLFLYLRNHPKASETDGMKHVDKRYNHVMKMFLIQKEVLKDKLKLCSDHQEFYNYINRIVERCNYDNALWTNNKRYTEDKLIFNFGKDGKPRAGFFLLGKISPEIVLEKKSPGKQLLKTG